MKYRTQSSDFRNWHMDISWGMFGQISEELPISFPGLKLIN